MKSIRNHDYSKYCYIPGTRDCDWEYITPEEAAESGMYLLSHWTKENIINAIARDSQNKKDKLSTLSKSILQRAFLLRCDGWFVEDGSDRDDRALAYFKLRRQRNNKDINDALKKMEKEKKRKEDRRYSR